MNEPIVSLAKDEFLTNFYIDKDDLRFKRSKGEGSYGLVETLQKT